MTGTRIAITGVGLTLPLGLSAATTWERSIKGLSAIGPLRRFDAAGHDCQTAAEVDDFDLSPALKSPKNVKLMSRSVQCALKASKEAVAASGIDLGELDPFRVAVYTGSGQTGMEASDFFAALNVAWAGRAADDLDFKYLGGRPSRLVNRYFSLRSLANAGVGFLAAELGAQGPSGNFVQGDTASAMAISAGFHDLVEGRCDIALAGGYESLLHMSTYLAYERAGLLSAAPPERAYRPFDRDRDGLVLGEGAGFMVLERLDDAERREAPIVGELTGCGSAMISEDTPDPQRARAALRAAIAEALGDDCADGVVARGIGTRAEDLREMEALADLFGDDVPVTAYKSQTGYVGAAGAAAELGLSVLALRDGRLPPIARLEAPDPDLGVNFVTDKPYPLAGAKRILCLSVSWAGQVAALAVRPYVPGPARGSG